MSAFARNIPLVRLSTLLAATLACALSAGAQAERVVGSGVSKTETRSVAGFKAIALGVSADLEVRQGSAEGVTITGDDNIVPLVATVVEDGTLKIRWANRRSETSYRKLTLVVDARTLEGLSIGGSGNVHADRLKSGSFKATIGGSGKVVIDALEATSVSVTLAGSGFVKLAGRTDSLEASLAGSGELTATRLQARIVRVSMQGSGQASVRASDTLSATIAGSGEVIYFGTPTVNRTILGSGSVRAGNDKS